MRDCKKFCWRRNAPVNPAPQPQEHDYSLDYLTTEALEDGTIGFTIDRYINTNFINTISYSIDNGATWTTINNSDDKSDDLVTEVPVTTGDKILWKADASRICFDDDDYVYYSRFISTCEYNVYGNVMSMLFEDEFEDKLELTEFRQLSNLFMSNDDNLLVNAENLILPATILSRFCYKEMFMNCTSLTTAPELTATTLAEYCYCEMFINCTSLTSAPELPATLLLDSCYNSMFQGCTSLTTAPELPATTLVFGCYNSMFKNCTSLTSAPELPATILASNCYNSMFYGCTALTTAPELPATELRNSDYACYYCMFKNCTSLNYIKCLAINISDNSCTFDWVNGVAASGTFVKSSNMSSWTTGDDGIPTGWTVQDA